MVSLQFLGCGDAFGTGGRFNTCFHVTSAEKSFLIDCGASSLVAMKKFDVSTDDIDTIFLTHLHGDHFAGTIFFLMDARYVAQRTKALTIAGPLGVKERIIETMNALYPGCWDKSVDFEINFVELEKGKRQLVDGIGVHPFNAKHLQDGNDFILRFDVEGKVITYSGDTGWTEDLVPAADHADLLIIESFFKDAACEFHLDYQTIMDQRASLASKQIILTHLGPEAMAHMNDFALPVAFDGMTVSV